MNRKSNPTESQNQSLQKFFEIYEKLLSDSLSFAAQEALLCKEEQKETKNNNKES